MRDPPGQQVSLPTLDEIGLRPEGFYFRWRTSDDRNHGALLLTPSDTEAVQHTNHDGASELRRNFYGDDAILLTESIASTPPYPFGRRRMDFLLSVEWGATSVRRAISTQR